jgi:thiamine biosynthesis lipoprotein
MIAALIAATLAMGGSARVDACQETSLRRMKPMMATLVTITVRGCDAGLLERRMREAFAEMERLAGILSEWDPHSAISRVNDNAGIAPVQIPRELEEVLVAAQKTSRQTSGAFDVTWAALAPLWKFDGEAPKVPAAEAVQRQRALVGNRHLILAAHTAYLDRSGMRVGLGGIAKGYIAQAAADLLVSRGVRDVLVAASGDIAARGRNGNRPWTAAVKNPEGGVLATVDLRDESISTAGDYEQSFVIEGCRYHHILDPRTGYPARGTRSVTVVAPRGLLADGLDTGLLVMGAEAGARVAASSGVAALFLDEVGKLHFSAGAAGRFTLARGVTRPSRERRSPCDALSAGAPTGRSPATSRAPKTLRRLESSRWSSSSPP